MRPDFATLPAMPGNPNFRLVNGCYMDREQYDTEQWHTAGTYLNEKTGEMVPYWEAELAGLQRYGALIAARRAEKKAAWQQREAEEDEFTAYINALDDAKPKR